MCTSRAATTDSNADIEALADAVGVPRRIVSSYRSPITDCAL